MGSITVLLYELSFSITQLSFYTFYILAKPKKTKKRCKDMIFNKMGSITVLIYELSSSITQLSFSLKLMKR